MQITNDLVVTAEIIWDDEIIHDFKQNLKE